MTTFQQIIPFFLKYCWRKQFFCRILTTTELPAAEARSDMRRFLCTKFKCRDSVTREGRALLVSAVNLGIIFFTTKLPGGHYA